MQLSENGLKLICEFEGCKLNAYQDVRGIWTVGYGHTAGVRPGTTVNELKARQFLQEDVKSAEQVVAQSVTVPLTEGQRDALISFVYNVGSGNFRNSTLLKLLNQGRYVEASAEFEKWDNSGGHEVAGLRRRRLAERDLFLGVTDV